MLTLLDGIYIYVCVCAFDNWAILWGASSQLGNAEQPTHLTRVSHPQVCNWGSIAGDAHPSMATVATGWMGGTGWELWAAYGAVYGDGYNDGISLR